MSTTFDEVKEIKEVITKNNQRVYCDWCGERIWKLPLGSSLPEGEIEFSLRIAADYHGEGGLSEKWMIEDLCLPCIDKMVKLLKDNGVNLIEHKVDW